MAELLSKQFQQKCEAVLRPELRKNEKGRALPLFEEKRKCSGWSD
jgi:hypothetical protein